MCVGPGSWWVPGGFGLVGAEGQILTESGAPSSTVVDPEAEAVRSPGMAIGSGDTVRLLRTAGTSGLPQFFHSKP